MTWLLDEVLAVVLRGEHKERALRRRHAEAAARLARASRALDIAEARLLAYQTEKAGAPDHAAGSDRP